MPATPTTSRAARDARWDARWPTVVAVVASRWRWGQCCGTATDRPARAACIARQPPTDSFTARDIA